MLGCSPPFPGYLWPNGATITYFFMDGNDVQQDKVRRLLPQWTVYGSVQFLEVLHTEDSSIRITFTNGEGSWSYLGSDCEFRKNDEPTMSLGGIDHEQSNISKCEQRNILHEFGHALGLLHENHPILKHAKPPDFRGRYFLGNYAQLDITSIMYFPLPRELTGVSYDVPLSDSVSDMDKAYMVINYPRAEPHPDAPDWTLEKALQVASLPDDYRTWILESRHNVEAMRYIFFDCILRERYPTWTKSPDSSPTSPLVIAQPNEQSGDGFTDIRVIERVGLGAVKLPETGKGGKGPRIWY
ncbi:zincin [Artomyces pyxidatus]|uniref:Zincin n=1 Tax=Artomyces pyxidatus TaxID=48021 RepID=A0ACB8SW02_9AGAM|nr:zincin [Artomyces pyxidatus]